MTDSISVPLFDYVNNNKNVYQTNFNVNIIEEEINKLLDKFNDFSKYYFNCNENYWNISPKYDLDRFDEMVETSFYIYLYKDNYNKSILLISNEINIYYMWKNILSIFENTNLFSKIPNKVVQLEKDKHTITDIQLEKDKHTITDIQLEKENCNVNIEQLSFNNIVQNNVTDNSPIRNRTILGRFMYFICGFNL